MTSLSPSPSRRVVTRSRSQQMNMDHSDASLQEHSHSHDRMVLQHANNNHIGIDIYSPKGSSYHPSHRANSFAPPTPTRSSPSMTMKTQMQPHPQSQLHPHVQDPSSSDHCSNTIRKVPNHYPMNAITTNGTNSTSRNTSTIPTNGNISGINGITPSNSTNIPERPESRCSQNSNASATSTVTNVTAGGTRRTTTSRRGGRVGSRAGSRSSSRSRSPQFGTSPTASSNAAHNATMGVNASREERLESTEPLPHPAMNLDNSVKHSSYVGSPSSSSPHNNHQRYQQPGHDTVERRSLDDGTDIPSSSPSSAAANAAAAAAAILLYEDEKRSNDSYGASFGLFHSSHERSEREGGSRVTNGTSMNGNPNNHLYKSPFRPSHRRSDSNDSFDEDTNREERRLAAQSVFRTKTTPRRAHLQDERDRGDANGFFRSRSSTNDKNTTHSGGSRWLERPPPKFRQDVRVDIMNQADDDLESTPGRNGIGKSTYNGHHGQERKDSRFAGTTSSSGRYPKTPNSEHRMSPYGSHSRQPKSHVEKEHHSSSGRSVDMDQIDYDYSGEYSNGYRERDRQVMKEESLLSPRLAVNDARNSGGSPGMDCDAKEVPPPMSPVEPPQIQLAHREPFFDVPCTPKTPINKQTQGIESTASFTLFNTSFDSLGDTDNLIGSRSFHMVASTDEYEQSPRKQNGSFSLLASPFSPHINKLNSLSDYINKQSSFIARSGSGDLSFDNREDSRYLAKLGSDSFGMPHMPTKRDLPKNTTKATTVLLTENGTKPVSEPMAHQEVLLSISPSRSIEKKHRERANVRSPNTNRTEVHPKSFKSEETSLPSSSTVKQITQKPQIQPRDTSSTKQSHESKPQEGRMKQTIGPYRDLPCPPRALLSSIPEMNAPMFYRRLNSHKAVFGEFTFVLPALKDSSTLPTNCPSILSDSSGSPSNRSNRTVRTSNGGNDSVSKTNRSPSPVIITSSVGKSRNAKKYVAPDSEISRRRVISAVYAFGGSYPKKKDVDKETPKVSIIREKDSSSEISGSAKYDLALSDRYFEHDNRISWEVEEDPPVEIPKDIKPVKQSSIESLKSPLNKRRYPSPPASKDRKSPSPVHKKVKIEDDIKSVSSMESNKGKSDQPKMRYRCKLCGQPKQNHICPYQQSLQRNIGVNVYPVLNAYNASEPGYLAPALAEMNNFVANSESTFFPEATPSRPNHERTSNPSPSNCRTTVSQRPLQSVTPDNLRGYNAQAIGSPRPGAGHTSRRMQGSPFGSPFATSSHPTPDKIRRQRLLSPPSMVSDAQKSTAAEVLFSEATSLRPEQFRVISPSKKLGDFKYPALPLPYPQRKAISDNLFAMSKEIPQLTDECALVLRQARERDMWDLAVAELMTQVVVVVHCPENDTTLDGLSQYLLSLGFSC